jgi:RNA polymerase sigma factor (sigma-70 family)
MASAPQTRPSLLVRIRDAGDRAAWVQFVEIYAPLVYRFARGRGLQDADAADLTQEVLQAVAGARRRLEYDPQRGTFRGWLFTVARNRLHNFLARQRRFARHHTQPADGQELEACPDTREEEWWEQEHRRRLFDWAAGRVRGGFQERTWRAFWATAVEGRSAGEVAGALGMSVGAVYVARSRVLARLREEIHEVTDE